MNKIDCTEPTFIAIEMGDGTAFMQRLPPVTASEDPLSGREKAVLKQYDTITSLHKEIERLKIKANLYAKRVVLAGYDDVVWEVNK